MYKSIKTPIAAILIGAVLVTSALVTWFAAGIHEDLYTHGVKSDMMALSQNLAAELTPLMEQATASQVAIANRLRSLKGYEHILAARVYDKNKVLLQSQTGYASRKLGLPEEGSYRDLLQATPGAHEVQNYLVVISPIIDHGKIYGYLTILNDINTPVNNSWKTLLYRAMPLVLSTLLLTIAIGLYWMNRWLTPLARLSDFTHEMAVSKDYSRRFTTQTHSEIGRLASNVNILLDTIEAELSINQEQNHTLIEQQQTMTRLANYDSLTGLPNRQFVMDNMRLELARAKRQNYDMALLFFDLDGFKGINDSLGHETGDLILIEVADRVSGMLREGDLVARLGGDEFIIIPDRDVSEISLKNLASRVISAFSEPFHFRGLALTVGVSIGIAKASDANFELSQLMSNADLAMYRSKARGRGIYTIFTHEMVESHKRKLAIANSIDQAIIANEFVLYYQPKVDRDGYVVGFEALIRWHHPQFGMVMPAEFIPVAEQSGKVTAITHWVIERVSIELPLLQSVFLHKFRVAINLSGHDLRHGGLFDMIHQVFERQQVDPDYIEFEVTESAYLENFAFVNKFFKRLSNMGCAISLDDFGTGYSSLSYLTQIAIDTLKIDRQFIRELGSSERSRLVTGSIIDLAKRLSLNVCAEGIEDVSQWEYAIGQGCDQVQGYLFSRPLPLDKVSALPTQFERGGDLAALHYVQ